MIDTEERINPTALNLRIAFDFNRQIMEADFSDFHFESSRTVNMFYDRLEARIAETGEDSWFFLVNLNGTRIDPEAWFTYSRRGRALNLAHSMGSVRYDASEETRRQIEHAANTEAFDPNLFASRDAALARLTALPSTRRVRVSHDATYVTADFVRRVSLDDKTQIMEADFSHFTFHHARDVDDFYDHLEQRMGDTGRKWYFLVNLNGCEIMPAAWIRYSQRGKRLNEAFSLGSVRYAAESETEADIRMRAETGGFRPNIRNTREEALDLIEELKAKSQG